ncbi:MAG: glutaminyl-peptide cyclotransferase [Prevotellaceae bacterium]|jgi:glutamine cyclotransferase|nr:glutaminyl-peptide cyclotransferase [Prevotellaceae bacterium]
MLKHSLKRSLVPALTALTLVSCFGGSGSKSTDTQQQPAIAKSINSIQLVQPKNGDNLARGSEVTIQYLKQNFNIDSAVAYVDGKPLLSFTDTVAKLKVNTRKLGAKTLIIKFFSNGVEVQQTSVSINLLPSNPPRLYGYKVVAEYPHNERSYTQGLQYVNGFMYEGTGGYGESSLQKVDIQTGKVLQIKSLDKMHFGEGICLLHDLIYQLTWREQRCLVYDAKTFDQKITLPYNGEGWGLTSDGIHLIMSDGSHRVTYRSPQDFSVVKQLEVCSNKGYVSMLNELELIEGELWANVYTTDQLVRIDTSSGEVTGVVDVKGLLPKPLRTPQTDVLNGIAYDATHKRIFVTGKNWKRLYEVQVRKKR